MSNSKYYSNFLCLIILLFCALPLRATECPDSSSLTSFSTLFGRAPGDVTIQSGQSVILDTSITISGGITVQSGGILYFAWDQDLTVKAQYIIVKGALYIGTESCPVKGVVDIELTSGTDRTLNGFDIGQKVIAVGYGGVLEMHGAKGLSGPTSWTHLAQTATKGDTTLSFAEDVASADNAAMWGPGDRLVLASTDFSPLQTEVVTIQSVVDSRTVNLASALSFTHFGQITFGADERAEVGLLNRNIVVHGSTTVGAHLIVTANASQVHIEGVEFYNAGQDKIARYPIHFHMVGETPGDWYARYNSIHDTLFRCVTIHATNSVNIVSNVCYNILGHSMYLEDGVERKNRFERNLVIMTRPKPTGERIGSDRIDGISGFWITNADNYFVDNVAAASYGTGFWIHARLGARGVSKDTGRYTNVNPSQIPLLQFSGNVAHSVEDGFQIEATYFDANDNPKVSESPPATYAPRTASGQAPTIIDNFTAYKIRFRGIWARVEDIFVINSTFADCYEGVQLATSGAHPPAPSEQVIEDTLFVGVSDNRGSTLFDSSFQGWDGAIQASYPLKGEGLTGWKVYDGTQGVRNCEFVNYPKPVNGKNHAAIGTRLDNHGQISTTNFAQGLKLQNVTRTVYFVDKNSDGGRQANFRDLDGSVSGHANAHILHDMGFFRTENCVEPEGDNWIACPHKYNHLWVLDMTTPNSVNKLAVYRNQHVGSDHTSAQIGFKGFSDSGIWRYQPIVSVGASYMLQFSTKVPSKLALQMVNAEQNETVEIVICYPRGASITAVKQGFANPNGAGGIPSKQGAMDLSSTSSRTSSAYLAGDAYYWDASRSLMFVNVKQSKDRSDYGNFCPSGGCDFVWIEASNTNGARMCSSEVYSGSNSLQIQGDSWLSKAFDS